MQPAEVVPSAEVVQPAEVVPSSEVAASRHVAAHTLAPSSHCALPQNQDLAKSMHLMRPGTEVARNSCYSKEKDRRPLLLIIVLIPRQV